MATDPAAAREVVRRSGQMGVPMIVAGDEVIVGFDRPRLEQLARGAAQAAPVDRPKLGLRVKDAVGGGAEVGDVRPRTGAERAGIRAGDVVEAVAGRPIRSADELEEVIAQLPAAVAVEIRVRRGEERRTLRLEP